MKRVQPDTGQRVLFTGPDGIGDYRPRINSFPRSIGIGPLSPDATTDLEYLFRAAPHSIPPLPKHCYTGEVGWGLHYSKKLNKTNIISSKQNELDEFHCVADGVTHSQWHTPAQFWDKQLPGDREPWNHNTHDTYSNDNTKTLVIYKRQSMFTEKNQTDGNTFQQIQPGLTMENNMRP